MTTIGVKYAMRVLGMYDEPVPAVQAQIDFVYASHFWAAAWKRGGAFYEKGMWFAPRPTLKPIPQLPKHLRSRL